ncbi:MAG: hypothetical protein ABII01_07585 [Candidatus Woesearchaeota archaeon]
MRTRILSYILLSMIILGLASAIDEDYGESQIQDNQPTIEEQFDADPVTAFKENPAGSWQYLESNPSQMNDPDILEASFNNNPEKAATIIDSNTNLLDNNIIMGRVEQEGINNVFIFNNNPNLKNEWLRQKSITDNGVQIESYDGSIIRTAGIEGTSFNPDDFPGASVEESGRLVLPDETTISSGIVTRTDDDAIIIAPFEYSDGNILSNSEINGQIYSSGQEMILIRDDSGLLTISGDNVIIGDYDAHEGIFTGSITLDSDHINLNPGTQYTEIGSSGQKFATFNVQGDNPAEYHNEQVTDHRQVNYIEIDDNGNVIINPIDSDIIVTNHALTSITIRPIEDDSRVIIGEEDVIFTIGPGNDIIYQGNPSMLSTQITREYYDDGELHKYIISPENNHEGTTYVRCSECFQVGISRNNAGTIRDIRVNPGRYSQDRLRTSGYNVDNSAEKFTFEVTDGFALPNKDSFYISIDQDVEKLSIWPSTSGTPVQGNPDRLEGGQTWRDTSMDLFPDNSGDRGGEAVFFGNSEIMLTFDDVNGRPDLSFLPENARIEMGKSWTNNNWYGKGVIGKSNLEDGTEIYWRAGHLSAFSDEWESSSSDGIPVFTGRSGVAGETISNEQVSTRSNNVHIDLSVFGADGTVYNPIYFLHERTGQSVGVSREEMINAEGARRNAKLSR